MGRRIRRPAAGQQRAGSLQAIAGAASYRGSDERAVSRGVVDIGEDAGIVHVEEFGFGGVSANHVAGGAVRGERQKFGNQVRGKTRSGWPRRPW